MSAWCRPSSTDARSAVDGAAAQRLRHVREGRETLPVAESGLPSRAPSVQKGSSCFLPSTLIPDPTGAQISGEVTFDLP
jgi:hypothetical protein